MPLEAVSLAMALNACLIIIRNIIRPTEKLKGLCLLLLEWIDRRLWDYKLEPGGHARARSSRKACECQMRSTIVDSLKGRGVECVWRFWIPKIPLLLCHVNLGLLVYFTFPFRCLCPFFSKSHLDLSTVICGVSRIGR
jgi:hypothetical protein